MSAPDLYTSTVVFGSVAACGRDAPSFISLDPHRKGIVEILAYFSRERHGHCGGVALATGLSQRTVRRRLREMKEAGVLQVSQTKTFPSLRRYSLPDWAEEIARTAASMLKELQSRQAEL